MDHCPMTASVPRALRLGFFLAVGFASILGSTGCHKRRSAMRPVIVSPSGPVEVRPGATVIGEPELTTAPSVELERPLSDPGFSPSGGTEINARPAAPEKIVTPRRNSPPVPDALDEPELSIPDPPRSRNSGKAGASLPDLNGPDSGTPAKSAGLGRQTGTGPRVRQASSLRERVRPFVNDPDDLFAPPKADRPWKYVVIHHSANPTGGYDQIDREHRKIQGWDGCGYHFVIGNGTDSPDGQIEVARRWASQKQGLHCRNGKYPDINEYGIGICLIGDFDKSEPTAKQLAAVKALTAYLAERYQIPANKIGTHGQMASSQTACPGENFPADEILGRSSFAAR